MININKYGVSFAVTETTEYLNHFWGHLFNTWEESTYQTIIPYLDKEKTFLDIGAWQGPISMVAQNYSKQCICFEPDPIAFSNLCKNVELNNFNNIIPINKAVSEESTLKIGHPAELGGGGSSYLTDNLVVECNTISIKEILDTYKLNQDNISLIKIDIEGYECELLRDPVLKNLKVPMHISMHPFMFKDKQVYFDKMKDFFGSYNYINYNIDTYEIFIDKRL
jgi:FkbM family methyltransferase